MKQNKYDDVNFFAAYAQMPRSINGLEGAGEWHVLKAMLPNLESKNVLDLGCGFGWHCRYAREQHASSVVGVDISENMLQRAREMTDDASITYIKMPIEDINFSKEQFDVVISSLAFHYIENVEAIFKKVYDSLTFGGSFIFSVEHPIFTARNEQDWIYDNEGKRLHWAVDSYQYEGVRHTSFLTEDVTKYHRTLSTYMNNLIEAGFTLKAVKEPTPSELLLQQVPEMTDEMRRPMFLIISAIKK